MPCGRIVKYRKCVYCKEELAVYASNIVQRFCNRNCFDKYREKKGRKTYVSKCLECGKEMRWKKYQSPSGFKKYCSKKCCDEHRYLKNCFCCGKKRTRGTFREYLCALCVDCMNVKSILYGFIKSKNGRLPEGRKLQRELILTYAQLLKTKGEINELTNYSKRNKITSIK